MSKIDRTKLKATSFLVMLNQYIGMQYVDLREFVLEINEMFNERLKNVEKSVNKAVEKNQGDQEYIDYLYDAYSDEHFKYEHTYSGFFLNATFVSSVSLFEYFFKRICEGCYTTNGKKLEDIKAKTSYIGRCKFYVTSIVGVDLKDLDGSWNEIVLYYKTRNVIVHELAHIKPIKEKQDVFAHISKSPHIKLEEYSSDFRIIDKQFVLDFIELANSYLTNVINKISAAKE